MATTPYRRTTLLVGRAVKRPHRILADDSYWNVDFLRRFLDRIDDEAVHDPQKAIKMADPTVELADSRISVRERMGSFRSKVEKRSFQVKARFVTASVARRLGQIPLAKQLYESAFVTAQHEIEPLTLAELTYRHGWLLFVHNDPDAGVQAQIAIDRCTGNQQAADLIRAEALILRGATKQIVLKRNDGIGDLARAIELVVDKRRSRRARRILFAASHALGKFLSESSSTMSVQESAYRHLERAKSLMGRQPKSVAKMQVNWHMGKIAFNLGLTKQGERLMVKARKGLRDLGEFQEFTLASLDLGSMYLLFGDEAAFQVLMNETLVSLEGACSDPDTLRMLGTWRARVPKDMEEILAVRRRMGRPISQATKSVHLVACTSSSLKER